MSDGVQDYQTRWEEKWKDLRPGEAFDTLEPHPKLVDMVKKAELSPTRYRKVLVPGCGRGYEVVYLAKHGFDATGLDISPTSIARAKDYAEEQGASDTTKYLMSDFFKDEKLVDEQFDLIIDYTFRCALGPSLSAQWARRMAELLRQNKRLLMMIFPQRDPAEYPGGPPFAQQWENIEEELTSVGFRVDQYIARLPPNLCHPSREDFSAMAMFTRV